MRAPSSRRAFALSVCGPIRINLLRAARRTGVISLILGVPVGVLLLQNSVNHAAASTVAGAFERPADRVVVLSVGFDNQSPGLTRAQAQSVLSTLGDAIHPVDSGWSRSVLALARETGDWNSSSQVDLREATPGYPLIVTDATQGAARAFVEGGNALLGASVRTRGSGFGSTLTVDGRRLSLGGVLPPSWRDAPSRSAVFVSLADGRAIVPDERPYPTSFALALDRRPSVDDVRAMQRLVQPSSPEGVEIDASVSSTGTEDAVERILGDAGGLLRGAMAALFAVVVIGVGALVAQRRRSELAVRRALGASSRTLLLMLLGEFFVLGTLSGIVGIALASYGLVVSTAVGSRLYEPLRPLPLTYALALPALAAGLLAVTPMWWASRADPAKVLRSSAE